MSALLSPRDPHEHSAPPDDAVPITAQDEQIAIEAELLRLPATDALDACYHPEYLTAIDIATARRDERLLGQLFNAIRYARAQKLALRELYGRDVPLPSPKSVCAAVFLRATSAADRRKA